MNGFGFGTEKIWYRNKYRIRYRKNLVSVKVSDSVSKKFGIGKSFGFGFVHILGILGDVSVSTSRFRNFSISKMVSDSASKKFGIDKSIGFGIVKIWYRKKIRIGFRSDFGYFG